MSVNESLGLTEYCSGSPGRTASPDFPGKVGLENRKMMASRRSHHLCRLLGAASLMLVAVAAAGCNTTQMGDAGALRATAAVPPSETDWHHEADVAGASYRADPNNPQAAIRYAQALRTTGERAQAAAVLEQACMRHPADRSLLGAYGRALADAGQLPAGLRRAGSRPYA